MGNHSGVVPEGEVVQLLESAATGMLRRKGALLVCRWYDLGEAGFARGISIRDRSRGERHLLIPCPSKQRSRVAGVALARLARTRRQGPVRWPLRRRLLGVTVLLLPP